MSEHTQRNTQQKRDEEPEKQRDLENENVPAQEERMEQKKQCRQNKRVRERKEPSSISVTKPPSEWRKMQELIGQSLLHPERREKRMRKEKRAE